jgi:hypothetical protein
MAIYAVNRSYFWNFNPCLKAWPLLSLPAAAGIRCSIPACPPCAGVHPWLKNEEEKGPPRIALFEIARVLVCVDHRPHDVR